MTLPLAAALPEVRVGGAAAQYKEFSELGKHQLQGFRGVRLVVMNTCQTPKEEMDVQNLFRE